MIWEEKKQMQNFQTKEREPSWSSSVTIYQAGALACDSGYGVGPMIRDHYLLHCVLDGKGIFRVDDRVYTIEKGEGFLIAPHIVTYYQADEKTPWQYCWIGFQGTDVPGILKRLGLGMEKPVFTFPDILEMENCVSLMAASYSRRGGGFLAISKLYECFSMLQSEGMQKETTLKLALRVHRFIDRNYSYHINVERIAEMLGCNRSHMFRVFKEEYGLSVQEYLRDCRLLHAKALLEQTEMSILEVMYSCGFDDLPNFSRQFKKKFGTPPGLYKKNSGCK